MVQTEATSKILFNTKPFFYNTYFLNFVEPSVRYSKFDSKYSYVQLQGTTKPVLVTAEEQLRMNQLSYLELGLKLNLFRTKLFTQFTEINAGIRYNYVDVRLKNDSINQPANIFSYYIEDRGGLLRSRNFGITYALGVMWQRLEETGLKPYKNNQTYIYPDISLFYHPKGDPSDKIFLRFKALTNIHFSDSYSLFQFGYSTKLSFKK